ncbi:MAG TPA: hypothetical protein VGE50_08610 [Gammaproteobacteria bacterium]
MKFASAPAIKIFGRGDRKQAGIALAIVLWLVALLAMMAVSLTTLQRGETAVTGNLIESAKATAAAQAGIQLALLELSRPIAMRQLSTDGAVYEARFDNATLWIYVVDEAGKVDLNFASAPLLDVLLHAADVEDETERARLVDAILDWRDSDELRRLQGAEAAEYQAAGRNYQPRNAPFKSVEELALVLGMSAPLYHRLAPAVTIYSGARTLNLDSKGALLRAFPHLKEEALLTSFEEAQNEDSANTTPAARNTTVAGHVFTIHCEARLDSGVREGLEAVVRFTSRRSNGPPLQETLAWREVEAGMKELTSDSAAIARGQ